MVYAVWKELCMLWINAQCTITVFLHPSPATVVEIALTFRTLSRTKVAAEHSRPLQQR